MYPISCLPCVAASCTWYWWRYASGLCLLGSLLTAVDSIHLVDEPPPASHIDYGFLKWLKCLWGYVYWTVFCRLWFGFAPDMYQGPLFMSDGGYFVCFSFVFLPVMYLGAVYLLFGCYSIDCFVLFTFLLPFGYCQVDFLTLPASSIPSVSILSYCYPIVGAFQFLVHHCQ